MTRKRYIYSALIFVLVLVFTMSGVSYAVARRVENHMRAVVGEIYSEDPAAAALLLNTLLSTDSSEAETGKGDMKIAEKLGYTGRMYDFYSRRIFPSGFVFSIGAALSFPFLFLFFSILWEFRRERKYRARLQTRIDAAMKNGYVFSPENDGERPLARVLSECARMKENLTLREGQIRQYVENVAHQIKTPLAGILLHLDLMKTKDAENENLNAALREAEKIRVYIGKLLKLARMQSGSLRLNKEPVDMAQLLCALGDELRERGISVRYEGPKTALLSGDRDWLQEAVGNLLDNAVKHNGGTSPVSIRLIPSDNFLRILIADKGKGISSGQAEALFRRYYVPVEDGSSTGIGLHISKEVVERHNGKITLSSGEYGGAVAEIFLPVYDLKSKL